MALPDLSTNAFTDTVKIIKGIFNVGKATVNTTKKISKAVQKSSSNK